MSESDSVRSLDAVRFDVTDCPSASIVVSARGSVRQTLNCLRSLVHVGAESPFEVIVATPGGDADRLRAHAFGLLVLETDPDSGAVEARNLAATRARSDLLVFLTSDVEVQPGWLDALLLAVARSTTVQVAGSLILSPDGLVTSLGGFVDTDGTMREFGAGRDPQAGVVRSSRDVDYCSASAMAVRRDAFEAAGGFDTRYTPDCLDDVDLCCTIRSAGGRVIVEPTSQVVRRSRAGVGLDRFRAVNELTLGRKWRDALTQSTSGLAWRRVEATRPRAMLIADPVLPTPDRDAGSRRLSLMLAELEAAGVTIYFAVGAGSAIEPYRRDLELRGVTVLESRQEQERFLEEAGSQLDAVMLCRPDLAWSLLDLVYRHAPQATLIYDTVDLHALRMQRQSAITNDHELASRAELMWIKERGVMQAADVTVVASEAEQQMLATLVPDVDVRVIPTLHSPVVTNPRLDGRRDAIFVGGYLHEPNVDAALWAAQEIMPLLRASVPDAALRLLGSYMPDRLAELNGPGIDAHGWAPDLTPFYAAARVVIAPLRFGAGMKGKVGEAIEHGVPVVGTSIAFEGMRLVDGVDVLVADSASDFAAAIQRLLTDDDLWRAMAGRGQELLEAEFSPRRAGEVLRSILDAPRRTRASGELAGL